MNTDWDPGAEKGEVDRKLLLALLAFGDVPGENPPLAVAPLTRAMEMEWGEVPRGVERGGEPMGPKSSEGAFEECEGRLGLETGRESGEGDFGASVVVVVGGAGSSAEVDAEGVVAVVCSESWSVGVDGFPCAGAEGS